jgi:tetratricopeptide (TPR) repeat protein
MLSKGAQEADAMGERLTVWARRLCLAGGLAAAATAAGAQVVASGAYLAARQADRAGDVEQAATRYAEALRRDPRNFALLEAATMATLAAGRVPEAAALAQRLVAADAAHRIGHLTLVASEIAASRFDAARARLSDFPDGFNALTASLLAGWAAFGAGDAEAAAASFAELDTGGLQQVFAAYHLGLLHAAQGEAEQAADAFARATSLVSTPTSRLAAAHGAALRALGRDEEARAVYERAAAGSRLGDPAMTEALLALEMGAPTPQPLVTDATQGAAEALFSVAAALAGEQGRRLALIHAQLATHLRPDLAAARLLIGELLEADGQQETAVKAYEQIGPDDPLWIRAQIGRAGALETLDRKDAATEALRALVVRAPTSVDARLALADILRRGEQWDAAADAYGAALDLLAAEGRENWVLHYQRGIALERGKRWPEAEAEFKRALELEPDQPLVLNYLGYSWVEMEHRLEEAKAMIRRAVEQRPQDGYITDSLGWVLYRMGDFEGAVTWLEKAVELAPVDPVINDHLGDALWMVGRTREAEFQWRRARSFDPEPDVLARIRRKLAVGLDAVLEEERAAPGPAGAAEERSGG